MAGENGHTSDGRDAGGRFAPGNPGGPGNPNARKAAHHRRIIAEAITDDDLRAAIGALASRAKSGDIPAIRELLDRAVGKPIAADIAEILERLERANGLD